MFRLRLLAILSTALPCDAYRVGLAFPESHYTYNSILDGETVVYDVKISTDGLLDEFPCAGREPPPDDARVLVPLAASHRSGHFRFEVDDPTVSSQAVGAWAADYWWGQYEDAAFDNGDQVYTWGIALSRSFRVAGEGKWCSTGVVIPHYIMTLGEDRFSQNIDKSELEGVKATLAIRFTYFDLDDDLSDRTLAPRNVTTEASLILLHPFEPRTS